MKLTLNAPKPRNPFAELARQRRAGSHQPSGKSMRQQQRHALRRELARTTSPDRHSP